MMRIHDKRTSSSVLLGIVLIFLGWASALGVAGESAFSVTLMNGSLLQGEPTISEVPIQIEGQNQSVPLAAIQELTPGLNRRPQLRQQIQELLNGLASENFFEREASGTKLRKLGPELRAELAHSRADTDLEKRNRVRHLLRDFEKHPTLPAWPRYDTLKLSDRTVTGSILLDQLTLATEYGELNIPLRDISTMQKADQSVERDLLETIDTKRHSIRGQWTLKDGVLVTPDKRPWALLQLDVKPPSSYRLSATVERKTGHDALIFPIVVGGKECNVCLDGWPRGTIHHTGLELIRGQGPPTNSTRHRGTLLHTNQQTSLHIDVTPTSVQLTVDHRQIFNWKGDSSVFSMQREWNRPDKTVLGLGSYEASFYISALTLSMAGREKPKIRAKQNAFVWELQDQTRIVLDSEPNQDLSITSQGEIQKIALSRIQSLLQQPGKPTILHVMDSKGEKIISGAIADESLMLSTAWGKLSLPISQVHRVTRMAEDRVNETSIKVNPQSSQ